MDVHAAALLHDGAHKAALGPDQGVVQLGGNGHLHLGDVGLSTERRQLGRGVQILENIPHS